MTIRLIEIGILSAICLTYVVKNIINVLIVNKSLPNWLKV